MPKDIRDFSGIDTRKEIFVIKIYIRKVDGRLTYLLTDFTELVLS